MLISLTATCKALEGDPYAYLCDGLDRIMHIPEPARRTAVGSVEGATEFGGKQRAGAVIAGDEAPATTHPADLYVPAIRDGACGGTPRTGRATHGLYFARRLRCASSRSIRSNVQAQ